MAHPNVPTVVSVSLVIAVCLYLGVGILQKEVFALGF